MIKTHVFGKIPEDCETSQKIHFEPVREWQFISADEKIVRTKSAAPLAYKAQLVVDDLQVLKQDLAKCAPTSDKSINLLEDMISIDMPLIPLNEGVGQSWTAGNGIYGSFGTRSQALRLLGIDSANIGDAGLNVGVIILDVGINRDYIEAIAGPGHYGGGWTDQPIETSNVGQYVDPHKRASDGHGNMIARNILSVAPNAMLYDAAILPDRVLNMHGFASGVVGALDSIKQIIQNTENNPDWPTHDHWILVNAWAVATSFADHPNPYSYADSRKHKLNNRISEIAALDNVDVVFAAGNAGAFQPVTFSGPYDRGHARSIWGANGLEEVFTIGAVRADGLSIGTSAQGPSVYTLLKSQDEGRTNEKPDLCTPSWFVEDDDCSVQNSGTSAAAGLFAGLLASVRSHGDIAPSGDLKADMAANASGDGIWNAQRGYGIPKKSVGLA